MKKKKENRRKITRRQLHALARSARSQGSFAARTEERSSADTLAPPRDDGRRARDSLAREYRHYAITNETVVMITDVIAIAIIDIMMVMVMMMINNNNNNTMKRKRWKEASLFYARSQPPVFFSFLFPMISFSFCSSSSSSSCVRRALTIGSFY